mmetsp:Transcript_42753/g.112492  ORF Transcript_42753/g.112492 Transcript_42753/m.112492 type:complete len:243 (+) Transcript_42753:17-745(+)
MLFLGPALLALSTPSSSFVGAPAQPSALTPPPPVTTAERLALRQSLTQLLPAEGEAPAFVRDDLLDAIEKLEAIEYVPQTPEFTLLGATGDWSLRALTEPEHASAVEAFQMRTAEIDLLGVEQCIGGDGTSTMSADFVLDDGALKGRLELDGTFSLTRMADSLDLRSGGRRLKLPRAPASMSVDELMQALHARLSAEFRADDDVRVGMQTMYMDEVLRVTRCMTGKLRGECMVHVRLGSGDN